MTQYRYGMTQFELINDMKKNYSCRSLKVAVQPPYQRVANPTPKRIEVLSPRGQIDKSDFLPATTKYSAATSYATFLSRKKNTSSGKKIYDNGNLDGYLQMKTRANDLEKKLVELKRNYEYTFIPKKHQSNAQVNFVQYNVPYVPQQPLVKKKELIKPKETIQMEPIKYIKPRNKLALDLSQQQGLQGYQGRENEDARNPLKNSKNVAPLRESIKENTQQNKAAEKNEKKPELQSGMNSPKNIQFNVFSEAKSNDMQTNQTNQTNQTKSVVQNVGQTTTLQNVVQNTFQNTNASITVVPEQSLHEYVTTFNCEPKTLLACTSESNIFKHAQPHNVPQHRYYLTQIFNAFYAQKPSSFDQLCLNHLTTSLEILSYMHKSKKQPPSTYSMMPLPKTSKQTIIFDLDETLIHCNQNVNIQHDVALPIKFPNGVIIQAGINVRPYARECLKELSNYFQLIVFTASHQCYANVIIDFLDPKKQLISHRYFRESCLRTEEGFYVKDLRVINRDPKKLVLVDNAAYSYCFQLENGVPIIPFYDNKADLELKSLVTYLKGMIGVKDMRVKNKDHMRLHDYHRAKKIENIIEKIYGDNENQ